MEKESLDKTSSVHPVLYSAQRQNSTVRKLSRLPAFPGEGAASELPVLYVRAPTSRVLNPNPMCAMYAVRTYRTRAHAEYVRRTAIFWKIRMRDYYARPWSALGCWPGQCIYTLTSWWIQCFPSLHRSFHELKLHVDLGTRSWAAPDRSAGQFSLYIHQPTSTKILHTSLWGLCMYLVCDRELSSTTSMPMERRSSSSSSTPPLRHHSLHVTALATLTATALADSQA